MQRACCLETLESRRLLSGYPIAIGSTGVDAANDVNTDFGGNVLVAGSFSGTVDFDPTGATASLGGGGGFLAKYRSPADGGGLDWARRFDATINKVAADRAGNVYIVGSFSGTVDFDPRRGVSNLTSAGDTDAFLVKLTSGGNLVYAKRFGGSQADLGQGLAVTTGGEVVMAGTFRGAADFNPRDDKRYTIRSNGGDDGFTIRLNKAGVLQWAGSFGGTGDEVVTDVALGDAGEAIVCGLYLGDIDFDPSKRVVEINNAGTEDAFVFEWDAAGQFQWVAGIGGLDKDFATGVDVDEDGNVYITGNFQNTADFNPDDVGTFNMTALATGQVFVEKLDSNGDFVWAKKIGGAADIDTGAGDINVDRDQNVYVTGVFSGTRDFDPSGGTSNLISAGGDDIFVAKFDVDGALAFAKQAGSAGDEAANSLVLSRAGDIVLAGSFANTVDFNPGGGTSNLVSNGSDDAYAWQLDTDGNLVA